MVELSFPGRTIQVRLRDPFRFLFFVGFSFDVLLSDSAHRQLSHVCFFFFACLTTELEDFLIVNRPEYLRHSAQNYTLKQKDYNNTLTARLIDHAEECGYGNLLHLQKYHQDFGSFTAVRDRIRGYYKSFLQSSRRREQRRQKRLAHQEVTAVAGWTN
jgi:hypothetical protein